MLLLRLNEMSKTDDPSLNKMPNMAKGTRQQAGGPEQRDPEPKVSSAPVGTCRVQSFATREGSTESLKRAGRAGRLGSPSHWRTIADLQLESTTAGQRWFVQTTFGPIGAVQKRSGFSHFVVPGHWLSAMSLAVVGYIVIIRVLPLHHNVSPLISPPHGEY